MKQASFQDLVRDQRPVHLADATSLDHYDVEGVVGCFSENAFIESPGCSAALRGPCRYSGLRRAHRARHARAQGSVPARRQ